MMWYLVRTVCYFFCLFFDFQPTLGKGVGTSTLDAHIVLWYIHVQYTTYNIFHTYSPFLRLGPVYIEGCHCIAPNTIIIGTHSSPADRFDFVTMTTMYTTTTTAAADHLMVNLARIREICEV
jgi:hypothetical protein